MRWPLIYKLVPSNQGWSIRTEIQILWSDNLKVRSRNAKEVMDSAVVQSICHALHTIFTDCSLKRGIFQHTVQRILHISVTSRNTAHQCHTNAIPTGYSHTNAHYTGGVNNYLNSNHTKYLVQLCGWFFCFVKFPPQVCESCGATNRRKYEKFNAL